MNDFDVVIVDEVHERHLVVDFVLGILREACSLGNGDIMAFKKFQKVCMQTVFDEDHASVDFGYAPFVSYCSHKDTSFGGILSKASF